MWPFEQPKIVSQPRKKIAVRMEAIGGQGANSAGKILAEAAVLGHNYTGNHFSSFGSEKRGSPVQSFVRFSTDRQPVRGATFVGSPDVLMVFHESMLLSLNSCLEGVSETTDLLVNTSRKPHELRLPTGIQLRNVCVVDASGIAEKSRCGLNAVMLGAVSALVPEIKLETLEEALETFFLKLPPKSRENNRNGFRSGAKRVESQPFGSQLVIEGDVQEALPRLGWLNAPIGGIITSPGNSVLKDNSVSRKGVVPRLLSEVCFGCGFCDMVCPDFCFVWERSETSGEPVLKGIDYQYCKACQKCISICPVEALIPVLESEITPEERQKKVFPSLDRREIESRWKSSDWEQAVRNLPPDERMLTIQAELLNPKTYLRPDFSDLNLKKKYSNADKDPKDSE